MKKIYTHSEQAEIIERLQRENIQLRKENDRLKQDNRMWADAVSSNAELINSLKEQRDSLIGCLPLHREKLRELGKLN